LVACYEALEIDENDLQNVDHSGTSSADNTSERLADTNPSLADTNPSLADTNPSLAVGPDDWRIIII